VKKQLADLAVKNTHLVEAFDQARVTVAKRQRAAVAATHAAGVARVQYSAAHAQFVQIIQAQYEGQSLGAAGALLDSDSGSNYVDRLDALDMITRHTSDVVAEVSLLRTRAAAASTKADSLLTHAKQQRDAVAQKRTAVTKQITKYRALLATLTAAQRAAYLRAQSPKVSPTQVRVIQQRLTTTTHARTTTTHRGSKTHATAAGTGAAQQAVQFALNQVGKPYVFGAAGPGAYDCSGLTMSAWQSAGVNLPHSAADQYNYGHHVSRDQLQPGDLIFFYQPIGHVTIYIGNGMMVSAPTEGENVQVVPLSYFNSDYAGATRLT
jgi:cell wall-associated NlpC family hydrolase